MKCSDLFKVHKISVFSAIYLKRIKIVSINWRKCIVFFGWVYSTNTVFVNVLCLWMARDIEITLELSLNRSTVVHFNSIHLIWNRCINWHNIAICAHIHLIECYNHHASMFQPVFDINSLRLYRAVWRWFDFIVSIFFCCCFFFTRSHFVFTIELDNLETPKMYTFQFNIERNAWATMCSTIQVDVFRKVYIYHYIGRTQFQHIHFGYPTVGGAIVVVVVICLFAESNVWFGQTRSEQKKINY